MSVFTVYFKEEFIIPILEVRKIKVLRSYLISLRSTKRK